jgi:hypothetical protein
MTLARRRSSARVTSASLPHALGVVQASLLTAAAAWRCAPGQ